MLEFIEKITFNELEGFINKKLLFKVRWQLPLKDGETEFKRIINEYNVRELVIKGVYEIVSAGDFAYFAVTTGKKGKETALGIYNENKYFDYFLFNGLLGELAEAAAEYVDFTVRQKLGFKESVRISPGYPAWPEISDQKWLLERLHAEKIGLELSSNFQLIPEHSISGKISKKQ